MCHQLAVLAYIVVPAVVSAYSIGFQERVGGVDDPLDLPTDIEWVYVDSDSSERPECFRTPEFDSGITEKIILQTPAFEARPPSIMAFFNRPNGQDNTITTPCTAENVALVVSWYDIDDWEQSYMPMDGVVFTHFQEIRPGNTLWSDLEEMPEGDVSMLGPYGGVRRVVGGVDIKSLPASPGESEFLSDAIVDYMWNPPNAGVEQGGRSRDTAWFSNDGQGPLSPALPLQAQIQASGDGGLMSQILSGGEIEEEEEDDEIKTESDFEGRDFSEMFAFREAWPELFDRIVALYRDQRQLMMNGLDGLYIPVPMGLHLIYTDEELEALGMPVDPVEEYDALERLKAERAADPYFDQTIPLTFRLFEGREPGILQETFGLGTL
ncbi:hypothetical protein DRE_06448 [Drechslerella stenobrocha 248]|uniref:Uncharacterized protein n=1 Tax=Drechslerella stenobrocha 248 TaxID=1043628 RepID=W7I754_9PEZI|nr:hypothetical protein DRE_06448 [Drechslerella stenobrocha 248]